MDDEFGALRGKRVLTPFDMIFDIGPQCSAKVDVGTMNGQYLYVLS